jgi:hypothetical protein
MTATTATITGTVDVPAYVYADTASTPGVAPGMFQLVVPTGLTDIVALSPQSTEQIAIEHGISVAANITVPSISFATTGGAVAMWAPTIEGLDPADTVYPSTTLVTANGTRVQISTDGGAAVPSGLLAAGDYHDFYVAVVAGQFVRWVHDEFATEPGVTYTLLPPLADIAFASTTSATFASLPDGVTDTYFATSDGARVAFVVAGANWIAAHDATALALDSAVPGLDPTWLPANTSGGQQLAAEQLVFDAGRSATLSTVSAVGAWHISPL